MMTLDEAIQHCEEQVALLEESAEGCDLYDPVEKQIACKSGECAAEHRQLAEWLKLLKNITESGNCNGCKVSNCEYRPKLGLLVRYNCPFYTTEQGQKLKPLFCEECGITETHPMYMQKYCRYCGAKIKEVSE